MHIAVQAGCSSTDVGVHGDTQTCVRFPLGIGRTSDLTAQLRAVARRYPQAKTACVGVPALADEIERRNLARACRSLADVRLTTTTTAVVAWLAATSRLTESAAAVVDVDDDHVSVTLSLGGPKPRVLVHEGCGLEACSLFHGGIGGATLGECVAAALAACCTSAGVRRRDVSVVHVIGRDGVRHAVIDALADLATVVQHGARLRLDALRAVTDGHPSVDDVTALDTASAIESRSGARMAVIIGRGSPLPARERLTYRRQTDSGDAAVVLWQGGAGGSGRFRRVLSVPAVGRGDRFDLSTLIDRQGLLDARLAPIPAIVP